MERNLSSYRCVVLLLVACMIAVCMHGGEAVTEIDILFSNVGESVTLYCDFHFGSRNTYSWSNNRHGYIAYRYYPQTVRYDSSFQDRERVIAQFVNTYTGDSMYGRFSLTVSNVTVADSAYYTCQSYNNREFVENRVQYYARVFDCSCTVNQQHTVTSVIKYVTCTLDSYSIPSFDSQEVYIYPNTIISYGHIQGNELTFSTNNDLREDLTITFNPFTDVEGSISCVVPAVPIITTTKQITTPSMSTSVTSSTEKNTTPPPTSYPSSSNYVSSTPSVSSATISRLMGPGEQKNKSQRTLIIAISAVGSSMILLLIIVIILLRSRKRQEHAPNAANHSQNGTKEEKGKVEETDMCYTSIQDTYPPEHFGESRNTEIKAPSGGRDSNEDLTGSDFDNDGMVDNVLYDFTSDYRVSRAIADPSTVDACGPLYTMPDKTSKSADRASVMSKRDLSNGQEAMHPSLASRGRADVTPSQNGATRCEDQTGDDDGGVAALYAVPDKGPGSRKKAVTHSFYEAADGTGAGASYVNVNLPSNTTQPEPGDIAALYAVVDKREKN